MSLEEPIFPSSATTKEPPLIAPVDVIVDDPVLIVPKPEVIEPAFNVPTPVIFVWEAVAIVPVIVPPDTFSPALITGI